MTKEEYRKLNGYYNDLCLGLSYDNEFFLNNMRALGSLATKVLMLFDDIELKKEKHNDCFTFFEIFDKSREIIKDINPKYLEDFDKIIDDGTINVEYEKLDIPYLERKLGNSVYLPMTNTIEIDSSFNYDMIPTIIHEYFHKINFSNNKARYLLTEFISIYYELYSYEYLKNQGVDKNELELYERLNELEKDANFLSNYTYFVYYFNEFGFLDEDSYKNMYDVNLTKEEYESYLYNDLVKFERLEKEYYAKYKDQYETYGIYLANRYDGYYRYFMCTILAYYALRNIDKEKVLNLNQAFINNKTITISEAFKILDIDLSKKDFDNELIIALVKYIDENDLIKENPITKK